jgi:predicted metal-dependent enzyme (double-stranded beta helix superfamily)
LEVTMSEDSYSIAQLVGDLKRIRAEAPDEHHLLAAVRPLALRAAGSRDLWLEERMFAPDKEQGFSLYPLSAEQDHSLAVFAFSWLPDRGTPPHDHGTWAVVAGVVGPEWNTFWRRQDDGSRAGYAKLTQIGAKMFLPGDVLAMPAGTIHQVWNQTVAVTISLHIYGMHINHTGRSQFDITDDTARPFIARVAT